MKESIFALNNETDFDQRALEIFRIQSRDCAPYSEYLSVLGIDPSQITSISQIPFLPVTLFKSRDIVCGNFIPEKIFTSSSTTGTTPSRHQIKDLSIYRKSFSDCFRLFYGDPKEFTILALLPSYLEREGSSLVYMADHLIKESKNSNSGFYLYNYQELYSALCNLCERDKKTLLIGVSFALLDFAEMYQTDFPSLVIIETGGMKGRGREISRDELHSKLKKAFGVETIGSEYGMAELLSQAWSYGDGIFMTPPWMRVVIRDLNNPFKTLESGKRGGINIIDLANIDSCSFIETEDMGIKEAGNTFRVLGRIKNSELRGCNLLLDN
ncbi:MAG: acyltransferase [Bacteroidales bacterium]|nr:acyltransferase [Bacteroidales bacterium]